MSRQHKGVEAGFVAFDLLSICLACQFSTHHIGFLPNNAIRWHENASKQLPFSALLQGFLYCSLLSLHSSLIGGFVFK